MQLKTISVFLFLFCIVSAELQGPPSDENTRKDTKEQQANNNNRKSSETNKNADEEEETSEETIEDSFVTLFAKELAQQYQGSPIKIVKAPDLSQEKDAQKVTEILSTLVSSHAKLIKNLEAEIEEIDSSIASLTTSDQPEQTQTPEEIELENIYEAAMKILNKTRSDKAGGFAMLKQAADKGHLKAQSKIAWAQLMGNQIEMNFEGAKETFLKLAEYGLPDAHMVINRFVIYSIDKHKKYLKFIIFCLGFGLYACCWNWF